MASLIVCMLFGSEALGPKLCKALGPDFGVIHLGSCLWGIGFVSVVELDMLTTQLHHT